jgi:hypothetical protein
VRSLTLLSLADPLLSVASTSWMSAVQRLRSYAAGYSTHTDGHQQPLVNVGLLASHLAVLTLAAAWS